MPLFARTGAVFLQEESETGDRSRSGDSTDTATAFTNPFVVRALPCVKAVSTRSPALFIVLARYCRSGSWLHVADNGYPNSHVIL